MKIIFSEVGKQVFPKSSTIIFSSNKSLLFHANLTIFSVGFSSCEKVWIANFYVHHFLRVDLYHTKKSENKPAKMFQVFAYITERSDYHRQNFYWILCKLQVDHFPKTPEILTLLNNFYFKSTAVMFGKIWNIGIWIYHIYYIEKLTPKCEPRF